LSAELATSQVGEHWISAIIVTTTPLGRVLGLIKSKVRMELSSRTIFNPAKHNRMMSPVTDLLSETE
ncbi:hypothetical protein PISMIDRAFT_680185, partial [Pisolithus microcarpus 441]